MNAAVQEPLRMYIRASVIQSLLRNLTKATEPNPQIRYTGDEADHKRQVDELRLANAKLALEGLRAEIQQLGKAAMMLLEKEP